jgi:hypothetical protein
MMTAALLRVLLAFVGIVAPASAETLNAQYVIYAGGFKALAITATAETGQGIYGVRANLKTMGVVDWVVGFSQTLETRGALQKSAMPRLYVSDSVFWRSRHSTRLEYRDDGKIDTHLVPAKESDDDRPPVPEGMKIGTVDPGTAFIVANRAAAEGGSPCRARIPVFDGRRRYNVVLEEDGVAAVEASSYSSFSGPALRCKFSMERLAGFQANPRFNAQTPPVSVIYLARFGQSDLWLPVRLESDSRFGNVIGHLVQVDAAPRPLGRSLRPAS